MGCPVCGGSERTPLAPGYYQCANKIEVRTPGPGAANPNLGPPFLVSFESCGHTYQEGTALLTPKCECGMFSVGECHQCGRPVCGNDGGRLSGRFLCVTCSSAERAAEAEEVARQANEDAERKLRVRRGWNERSRAQMAAHSDPTTGLFLAAAGVTTVTTDPRPWKVGATEVITDWRALSELTGRALSAGAPGWTLDVATTWFLRSVRTGPPDSVEIYVERAFGRLKLQAVAVWIFQEATLAKVDYKDMTPRYYDLALAQDGTLYIPSPGGRHWLRADPLLSWLPPATNISGYGIQQMLLVLGINPVNRPPVA